MYDKLLIKMRQVKAIKRFLRDSSS